jgi:hypothetical protein
MFSHPMREGNHHYTPGGLADNLPPASLLKRRVGIDEMTCWWLRSTA